MDSDQGREQRGPTGEGPAIFDLDIEGMTCASCALRIERRLNALEGIHATVNYALEQAHVVARAPLPPSALVAEIEAAGYRGRVQSREVPPGGAADQAHGHGDARVGARL